MQSIIKDIKLAPLGHQQYRVGKGIYASAEPSER